MRIKFLTSIAGMNYTHKPGDEVDWRDEAEAERFVKAGYATQIGPSSPAGKAGGEKGRAGKPEKADGKAGGEKATLDR